MAYIKKRLNLLLLSKGKRMAIITPALALQYSYSLLHA